MSRFIKAFVSSVLILCLCLSLFGCKNTKKLNAEAETLSKEFFDAVLAGDTGKLITYINDPSVTENDIEEIINPSGLNSEQEEYLRIIRESMNYTIDYTVFDGFDYVALGHIHRPQDVGETIRYSGTPMIYSFGKEEKQEKSVTILDTSDLSRKQVPLPLLHRWTTVTGTLEEVLHPDLDDVMINGYVRVRVTDSFLGLEVLSELKRVYPNLVDAAGKTFDNENSSVTMTVEELEALENDPLTVFRYFCKEETDIEPDDHLISLFEDAMKKATEAEA